MSRDFAAEMRALVDATTASGPYVSRAVAAEVVDKLRANDPELLDGWLHANAENFVWQMINDRDRSARSHARQQSGRQQFAAAAAEHEAQQRGESPVRPSVPTSSPLVRWLSVPFDVNGVRKPLADMTVQDLTCAASDYDGRAHKNAMTAAFLRAIAKKVKNDTVSKHFTDEQLSAMWQSLTGSDS